MKSQNEKNEVDGAESAIRTACETLQKNGVPTGTIAGLLLGSAITGMSNLCGPEQTAQWLRETADSLDQISQAEKERPN